MFNLAKAFRRITTSGGYVAEIDGLRFIAIMAVVMVHADGYWSVLAGRSYEHMSAIDMAVKSHVSLGTYGVHLFFMISGFVLAMPFAKAALAGGKRVDLIAYLLRRITRLEPPYIISMVAFFLFMPVFGKGSWRELWPHLLASLGYVHEFVYGSGSPINNNAWSLEIEIQFYLLMPLLAAMLWLPASARRTGFVIAALLLSLNSVWLPSEWPRSFLRFGQYFLIGIVLCDLWTTTWGNRARSWTADLPGIVSWPVFSWVNLHQPGILAEIGSPWIISLLFFSALRGTGHSRVLSYAWIPVIGGMCYSIYLLHARAIAAVVHGLLARLPLFGSFAADYCAVLAASICATLVVCAIFFLLVEKPCMNPAWPGRLAAAVRTLYRGRKQPRVVSPQEQGV